MPLDWGSVPDAAGSLMTGASFIVAAMAYRRSVLDRESAQAAAVSAWFEADGEDVVHLRVHNGGQGALYEVIVLLRPGHEEVDLNSVPPGTTVDRPIGSATTIRGPAPMRFRDGAGRYWRRDGEGRLTGFGGPTLSMRDAKRYKSFR